jgi:[CysO sulfur-carrier protein]-S-L-cysteine hydrolase
MADAPPVLGLELRRADHLAILAHLLGSLPEEGCGLLVGPAPQVGRADEVVSWYPTRNAGASALRYEVDPREMLLADREAEASGLQLIGVVHSHTHTDPYPSPTDIGQAPDPSWHYVIVSLRDEVPSLRSFTIVAGDVREEPVRITADII